LQARLQDGEVRLESAAGTRRQLAPGRDVWRDLARETLFDTREVRRGEELLELVICAEIEAGMLGDPRDDL